MGRLSVSSTISLTFLAMSIRISQRLGRYRRIMPLRFSLLPRCQLEYGSAEVGGHAQLVAQARVPGELGAVVVRDADARAGRQRGEHRHLRPRRSSRCIPSNRGGRVRRLI